MKRFAIVVSFVALVFGVGILAQPETGSVEQELINLENEWAKTQVKPDFAFIERILADDYIWITPNGDVLTRAQEIASLKSGEGLSASVVNDEMKVHVYGDAAVITGRTTYKNMIDGKEVTGQLRWTDTWVKIAGRWRCAANHNSIIPQK